MKFEAKRTIKFPRRKWTVTLTVAAEIALIPLLMAIAKPKDEGVFCSVDSAGNLSDCGVFIRPSEADVLSAVEKDGADVNHDGVVNVLDFQLVANAFLESEP